MRSVLLSYLSSWLVCFYLSAQTQTEVQPETTTGFNQAPIEVTGSSYMVVTANPVATHVANTMIQQGGNAIDAMVAAQIMLNLVEPQSSGIGGGSFAVYWDAKKQHLTTFDGRETAPLAVTPSLFQDKNGKPLAFFDAVIGGRSVGTPGTLKLLWDMHQRFGKLPWKTLLQPTIQHATRGFLVSQRLATLLERAEDSLKKHPTTQRYFFDNNGKRITQGTLLKNPDLAYSLTRISEQGEKAFYHGEIGQAIVEAVRNSSNPGRLSLQDLNIYRVKERIPICTPYRSYKVCGMGPPSSGAVTLGQILGILEHFPLKKLGPRNAQSWRLIADATRLAFADRDWYLADTDYVDAPIKGMLSKNYLTERANLIRQSKRLVQTEAGNPPWPFAKPRGADQSLELNSTTHISIVDKQGNIVSVTSSIENGFGSRVMIGGFLLNNQLTDFSFKTNHEKHLIANSVAPGKRPRSSMAPTIVFDSNNNPVLVLGSPGGSRIIPYVATTIIRILDWKMSPEQAVVSPHLINRYGTYEIEPHIQYSPVISGLKRLGYPIVFKSLNSGLHVIELKHNKLIGGADPRREGLAMGQ